MVPRIDVRVIVADGLTREADLAIIGPGRRLRTVVERSSGAVFGPFRQNFLGLHPQQLWRTNLLVADNFVWRRVVSLSGRSGRRVRHSFHQEWLEVLLTGLTTFEPKSLVLIPYSHRHPSTVAATMLFHIWLYHSWDWESFWRVARHTPRTIEIVTRTDAAVFAELASREDRLRTIFARESVRIFGAPQPEPGRSLGLNITCQNGVA